MTLIPIILIYEHSVLYRKIEKTQKTKDPMSDKFFKEIRNGKNYIRGILVPNYLDFIFIRSFLESCDNANTSNFYHFGHLV